MYLIIQRIVVLNCQQVLNPEMHSIIWTCTNTYLVTSRHLTLSLDTHVPLIHSDRHIRSLKAVPTYFTFPTFFACLLSIRCFSCQSRVGLASPVDTCTDISNKNCLESWANKVLLCHLTALWRCRLMESIMKASGQVGLSTMTCWILPSLEVKLLDRNRVHNIRILYFCNLFLQGPKIYFLHLLHIYCICTVYFFLFSIQNIGIN